MKRMAIFGSRGYLGTQLSAWFSKRDWEVEGFDRPECDVTSESWWQSFDVARYDCILFFAGLTGTEKSFAEADDFLSVNERGLLNLLKLLAPLGAEAPLVIFPSTRLVYKGAELPLSEDAPMEAKTVYAANKLACEALLQAYAARYGLRYAVTRICVPYGSLVAHDYSYGTVGMLLKQAASGKITLYGDGRQRRTFTHVVDICERIGVLAEKGVTGVYNIGGHTYALCDIARRIADREGAIVAPVSWPDAARRMESGSTFFDSSRLDLATGLNDYRDIIEELD